MACKKCTNQGADEVCEGCLFAEFMAQIDGLLLEALMNILSLKIE